MTRVVIDTEAETLVCEDESGTRSLPLYSDEAFEIVSHYWVKTGWNQKYPYTFTWMGRPLIQLPEDIVRIQEVIWNVRPDVILETGVAHGGSLIFYASLCAAMECGRVIGVDIEIRPANRSAVEAHSLAPLVTMIEGDSTAAETVAEVSGLVADGETVLVILDSDHGKGAMSGAARCLPFAGFARLVHRRHRRRDARPPRRPARCTQLEGRQPCERSGGVRA